MHVYVATGESTSLTIDGNRYNGKLLSIETRTRGGIIASAVPADELKKHLELVKLALEIACRQIRVDGDEGG